MELAEWDAVEGKAKLEENKWDKSILTSVLRPHTGGTEGCAEKGCEEKGGEEDVAEWDWVEGKPKRGGSKRWAMRACKGEQAPHNDPAEGERCDGLVMEKKCRRSDCRCGSRERPCGSRGDSMGKAGHSVSTHLFWRIEQLVAMA